MAAALDDTLVGRGAEDLRSLLDAACAGGHAEERFASLLLELQHRCTR